MPGFRRQPTALCDPIGIRLSRQFAIGLICLTIAGFGSSDSLRAAEETGLALVNAHVLVGDGTELKGATVLIQGDRIVSVGKDVEIPAGVRQIDVSEHVVSPGLIDLHSKLWVHSAVRSESSATGSLHISDGIDSQADDWKDVIGQGVTMVYCQPSGVLGGAGAILRVSPEAGEILYQDEAFAQASLGISGTTNSSRARRTQFDALKRALDAAKKYGEDIKKAEEAKAKAEKEAKEKAAKADDGKDDKKQDDKKKEEAEPMPEGRGRGRGRGFPPGGRGRIPPNIPPQILERMRARGMIPPGATPSTSSTSDVKMPPYDPAKAFLLKVLNKEVPLRVEAHRPDDVASALELAKAYDLNVTLEGVDQPSVHQQQLAELKPQVIVGPAIEFGEIPAYRLYREPDWLRRLQASGATLGLGTFSTVPAGSALLRVQLSAAIAKGMSRQAALAAVTTNAARILGIADQVGSVEAGKLANLAVFRGHPCDSSAPVRLVISDGKIVHEASASTTPQGMQAATSELPGSLPPRYAIRSRVVFDGLTTEPRTLIISQGKIESIADAKAPVDADLPLFDLGDHFIAPGLVTSLTTLGVSSQVDDGNLANAAHFKAADAWSPELKASREFGRDGVFYGAMVPGKSSVITARVGGIRLVEPAAVVSDEIASQWVLDSASRNTERFPASLMGQRQLIANALEGKLEPTNFYLPDSVLAAIDQQRAAHVNRIKKDRLPVLIHVATEAEAWVALELAEQFDLNVLLIGLSRWESLVDRLKAVGASVIARPVTEANYAEIEQLVRLSKQGVPVVFAGIHAKYLRSTASLCVSQGMSMEWALRGLTSEAGRLTGMPQSVGRIAAGGPAEFCVWTGNPLDLSSRVIARVVDGNLIQAD